jgi:hypothetical protein
MLRKVIANPPIDQISTAANSTHCRASTKFGSAMKLNRRPKKEIRGFHSRDAVAYLTAQCEADAAQLARWGYHRMVDSRNARLTLAGLRAMLRSLLSNLNPLARRQSRQIVNRARGRGH